MIKNITNKDIVNGSFIIPEGVTEIGIEAFERCSSLKNITLPEGLKKIWDYAFEDCTSLESIIIPESVTEIGIGAFGGCTSLKKVSLPKKFKLGHGVFYRCLPDLKIEYRD